MEQDHIDLESNQVQADESTQEVCELSAAEMVQVGGDVYCVSFD